MNTDVTWPAWIVIVILTLSALATISQVGKDRKPLTGGMAVAVVITNVILVGLIVWSHSI